MQVAHQLDHVLVDLECHLRRRRQRSHARGLERGGLACAAPAKRGLASLQAVPRVVGVVVVGAHEDGQDDGGVEPGKAAGEVGRAAVAHDDPTAGRRSPCRWCGPLRGSLARARSRPGQPVTERRVHSSSMRSRPSRPAWPVPSASAEGAAAPPQRLPGSIGPRMGILDRILRAGEGKKIKALAGLVPDINAVEAEMKRPHRRAAAGEDPGVPRAPGERRGPRRPARSRPSRPCARRPAG